MVILKSKIPENVPKNAKKHNLLKTKRIIIIEKY